MNHERGRCMWTSGLARGQGRGEVTKPLRGTHGGPIPPVHPIQERANEPAPGAEEPNGKTIPSALGFDLTRKQT